MSIFSNTHLAQLYIASKMNDPLYPHVAEVRVPEKTQKYKRFAHEKRVNRTPGVRKVQTPHIITTKWDVEISNKRNKKIGRSRDRDDKYGNWNENQTDTLWEDAKNAMRHDVTMERVHELRKQARRLQWRVQLDQYNELLFPVYSLTNRDGWPCSAWEAYGEFLEHEAKAVDEMLAYEAAWQAILNSPEQLAINAANDEHNTQQAVRYGPIREEYNPYMYDIELESDCESDR